MTQARNEVTDEIEANMRGGTLLELTSEILAIEHALMESGGELPPELESQLELVGDDLREKVDRYHYILDALEARAGYFKELEAQGAQARKVFENQRKRLRERLKLAASATGTNAIEGNDWRYLVTEGKEKMVINQDELPPEFYRVREVKEPDRAAIEDMLRCGFPVPGVSFEKSSSLRCYVNAAGRAREVTDERSNGPESIES